MKFEVGTILNYKHHPADAFIIVNTNEMDVYVRCIWARKNINAIGKYFNYSKDSWKHYEEIAEDKLEELKSQWL
jgi:hypothetical protein